MDSEQKELTDIDLEIPVNIHDYYSTNCHYAHIW